MTITVLGVGNPIMADDGVGLAVLAAVQEARPDPRIEYVDGGTGGMALLPVVQEAGRLLVLDAVAGDEPGRVVQLDGDQVPRMLVAKLSPHQVGLLDVFTAARLLGHEPAEVVVIGVTPARVELSLEMSPSAQAAVAEAANRACALLDTWLGA